MTDLEQAQANGTVPWSHKVAKLSDFHITVFEDGYPVSKGHLLFVPNYNTISVIVDAMDSAMRYGQTLVDQSQCDGFNVGINLGHAAGQTVMYPHVHFIPRRSGDCEDPVGGVRGVIAGQANYKAAEYQKPA